MRRKFAVAIFGIVAIVLLAKYLLRPLLLAMIISSMPTPSPEEIYPPAPPMPPVVATPVQDLLAEYEAFLGTQAPKVLAVLQPGLTEADIDTLETKHAVKLTADLRALYRWRNGVPQSAGVAAFPDHFFIPLDDALELRVEYQKQIASLTPEQAQMHAAYARHRDPWIDVLVDGAGGGHFFDPNRTESEGSFFYHFGEEFEYTYFPAFRNYLAAIVEGQKSGVFKPGGLGVETADFEEAEDLWLRFGAQSGW